MDPEGNRPVRPYTRPPLMRFHYDTTASTNDAARALVGEHPGRVLLVSAAEQTAGRGRAGRDWRSPRGGAWFSLAVPVNDPRPTAPLSVGLAVRRVVSVLAGNGGEAEIKWPNDILLRGRKVAGILCEQVLGDRGATLILGVGINVNNRVRDLPDLRYPAASLNEAVGHDLDVDRLIDHTAQTVLDYLRRPLALDIARRHLAWRGETVRVTLLDREHRGTLVGLDAEGRLLLQTEPSETLTLDAGDVSRVRLETESSPGRTEPLDPVPA